MWMSTATRYKEWINGLGRVTFVKRIELTIKLWMQAWSPDGWNLRWTPATSGRGRVVDGRIPAGSASTRLANPGRGLWWDQSHLSMMSSEVG